MPVACAWETRRGLSHLSRTELVDVPVFAEDDHRGFRGGGGGGPRDVYGLSDGRARFVGHRVLADDRLDPVLDRHTSEVRLVHDAPAAELVVEIVGVGPGDEHLGERLRERQHAVVLQKRRRLPRRRPRQFPVGRPTEHLGHPRRVDVRVVEQPQ